MEADRIGLKGRIGPITRLQELEVVFPLISDEGHTKVWLRGSIAHDDEGGVKENVEIKVYGRMLGNLLLGEQVIFNPARKPGKKVKR